MTKNIINLDRTSKKKVNAKTIKNGLEKICQFINKVSSLSLTSKIRSVHKPKVQISTDGETYYLYQCQLEINNRNNDEEEFKKILKKTQTKISGKSWSILEVVGDKQKEIKGVELVVPPLTPEVVSKYFDKIYDRDPHIRIINDILVDSFKNKKPKHLLLYGDASSCKTTILKKFKDWYEIENPKYGKEIISILDGTTLTKAGLENWIIDKTNEGNLPGAIVIEEIEKQPMDNLLCLLSVMASGRIKKLNAKVDIDRKINICIIATCNNGLKLKDFKSGALWSRFSQKLPCTKPRDKAILAKILMDEIKEIDGKPEWCDKIIEFTYEEYPSKFDNRIYGDGDPRVMIGLLASGDRLLDGSAQKDIIEVMTKGKKCL